MKYLIVCYIFIFCGLICKDVKAQEVLTTENGLKIVVEEYLQRADKLYNQGDKKEATKCLNDLANAYWEKKQYNKAIDLFLKSIVINKELDNQSGIASIYSNMGMIDADMANYQSSSDYFTKSIEIRKRLKEKQTLISTYINLSVSLNNLKKYDESAKSLENALNIALEMNSTEDMKSCYGMLAETYQKSGNNEKMMSYYKLYQSFTDLVENQKQEKTKEQFQDMQLKAQLAEMDKRNQELELSYKNRELEEKDKAFIGIDTTYKRLLENYSRKQLMIEIINQKSKIKDLDLAREKERIKKDRMIFIVLAFAIIIGLLFLIYIFIEYRQKKRSNILLISQNAEINQQKKQITEQRDKIEESLSVISKKNKDITSSIRYAKIIQEALLTERTHLRQLLPESFILFHPRDIVSGDFYWYREINNKIIVVAADCTGHGVPGAFMSMLGHNLLDQIIYRGITEPSLMLGQLNLEIIKALHQSESGTAQDGMDIAMFQIDKTQKKLLFAGAKNPLVYIQNGELFVINGDKEPIGSILHDRNQDRIYTTQIVDLTVPICAYIFSDGYNDQFGAKTNKKFSMRKFKELVLSIYDKPMLEQEKIFEQTFLNWMGDTHQIDDVMVIGAKIEL